MSDEPSISIDTQPTVLAAEIAKVIEAATPSGDDISAIQRQLLSRHAELGLRPKVSSEEVVESFFRCVVIDHLQQRFKLEINRIPNCVNSSHTAARRVCAARWRHCHDSIADPEWRAAWLGLQERYPEVNIRVPDRRSPKRADLYLVARDKIVSLEFKYIGPHRLGDVNGCAVQMRHYAENHAATLLVVYSGSNDEIEGRALARLRGLLDRGVRVACVYGPSILPVSRAT